MEQVFGVPGLFGHLNVVIHVSTIARGKELSRVDHVVLLFFF